MCEKQEDSRFELPDMSPNSEQHEILLEESEPKQYTPSQPQWSRAFLSTRRKTFYTTLLLLFIVSGIMAVVILHYTAHNKDRINNDNKDDRLPRLRAASIYKQVESPESFGRMNIYIRTPTQDGIRRRPRQFRFPVARYGRRQFPLNGPFLSFAPSIPMFADRLTRQTIIYSPTGVYILPPLINFYGKMFSVAELVASGYASLVSSGAQPTGPINMISYFQPTPLYGVNIPTISPLTGSFVGGIQTDYDSFVIPKYPRTSVNMDPTYETKEENDDHAPSYPKNNYNRPRPRPRPRRPSNIVH